jgi:hypothetical protein
VLVVGVVHDTLYVALIIAHLHFKGKTVVLHNPKIIVIAYTGTDGPGT